VVDTGATSSAIDSEVAQALRLPSAGRGTKASGVSCTATVHPVRIADWSIGSLQLRGQTVESSSIPNFGLHQAPAGLLGSDVLSRFGAVRIDYQHQRLILPGPEGPAPTIKGIVRGPTTVPTPASLLAGYPAPTSIPMVVGYEADQVIAVAPVRFGRTATLAFVIDTGSSRSAISRQAAAQLGLRSQGKHQPVSGATCETTASIIKVASWSLGAKPLAGGTLLGVQIPAGEGGIEGLLGSDQLSRFGSVVIDYAGGRLLV
jgi:predicted aspartyl protease